MEPKETSDVLSVLKRSGEKTEIVLYLHKIYPNTVDVTDISRYTGIESANSLKALRDMGLVDMTEENGVKHYKLSKGGKSLIDNVEPPTIFYDWTPRRKA